MLPLNTGSILCFLTMKAAVYRIIYRPKDYHFCWMVSLLLQNISNIRTMVCSTKGKTSVCWNHILDITITNTALTWDLVVLVAVYPSTVNLCVGVRLLQALSMYLPFKVMTIQDDALKSSRTGKNTDRQSPEWGNRQGSSVCHAVRNWRSVERLRCVLLFYSCSCNSIFCSFCALGLFP